MDVVGKAGGTPSFSSFTPGGIHIGTLLTSIISFAVVSVVVYFAIVVPYTKATERLDAPKETTQPEDIALLTEIRDLLARRTVVRAYFRRLGSKRTGAIEHQIAEQLDNWRWSAEIELAGGHVRGHGRRRSSFRPPRRRTAHSE